MGGGKEKWRKWRLFWRRYWQFFSYCECAVVIGVVSSSTCVTILLQVCGNVLLSVIPWWGCSQSLLGSGWMGLIHSLPEACCAAFCRHFALYAFQSSCWHFSFCRPSPFCQLGQSLYYWDDPWFYTSRWCEPGLPLHTFQLKIETKMREGFRKKAVYFEYCADFAAG